MRNLWSRLLSYRPSAAMIVALIALVRRDGRHHICGFDCACPSAASVLPDQEQGSAQQAHQGAQRDPHEDRQERDLLRRWSSKDSLRGSDILESSLGNVPSATGPPTRPGNGLGMQKFVFRGRRRDEHPDLLNAGGLASTQPATPGRH